MTTTTIHTSHILPQTIPAGRFTKKEKYINGIWKLAQSAFWNDIDFSLEQQDEFKDLIAAHFDNEKSAKRNFKELAERICLAKRYVSRHRERYIPEPLEWLNIHFPNGLVGTAEWLDSVNTQRRFMPRYNEGIAVLSTGILSFIESPGMIVFYRYRKLLIAQKQTDLLQIFYNTIANLQFTL